MVLLIENLRKKYLFQNSNYRLLMTETYLAQNLLLQGVFVWYKHTPKRHF